MPLLLTFAVPSAAGRNAANDERLTTLVKHVLVNTLDAALPSVRFYEWLRIEAGNGAEFNWEVNDCKANKTPARHDVHRAPTCVKVEGFLKDGREIVISLAIDTSRKDGALTKAEITQSTVYSAQLITPAETINIQHISDFPAALIRTHQLVSYPEIAK